MSIDGDIFFAGYGFSVACFFFNFFEVIVMTKNTVIKEIKEKGGD